MCVSEEIFVNSLFFALFFVSYVQIRQNSKWMLVPQSSLWLPPETVIKIFEKYGFVWGGTWDEYDTMHFEYRPELAVLAYLYMADEE